MIENNLTAEEVRMQLNVVLQSDELINSPVLSHFLRYVVEKKLQGKEDEIKEYTIGVLALGRPASFNPQLDAIVRIHAGRLRKILATYYYTKGKNDRIVITIEKGTYVPDFLLNDETENTSLKKEDTKGEVVRGEDLYSKEYWYERPVIAVFPFHNYSSDHSRDYFARGIGEQLSIDLARFQNISIVSYYSTYKYQADIDDLDKLRKTFGFDYVLTGSVRFDDETLRLNMQLIIATTSEIIWSETYQHKVTEDNLFAIQQDITDHILNTVAGDNGIIIQRIIGKGPALTRTTNDTQDVIYRYYDLINEFDTDKYETIVKAFHAVRVHEPDNALISAMLADLYLYGYFLDMPPGDEIIQEACMLSKEAIKQDAQCQHAQKTLAWCFLLSGKKQEAITAADRCIAINPKEANMIASMGLAYICLGEYLTGFNHLVRSHQLSPSPLPVSLLGLALYYFHTGQYKQTLRTIEKTILPGVPLSRILMIAAKSKLLNTKIETSEAHDVPESEEKIKRTIDRLIMDEVLKEEIFQGLIIAGVIK